MIKYEITTHAAIRFLERVFLIKTPSKKQIENAKILILKDISNISTRNYVRYIPLPSISNFVAVKRGKNVITTILSKSVYSEYR